MKFGSCCGGGGGRATAENTTAAAGDTTGHSVVNLRAPIRGERSHALAPGSLRKLKSANSSRQWKPSLHAISEDSLMVSDVNESSDKAKVKAQSKPKAKSSYYGEEYWKPSGFWVLPVFAPTPF